MKIWEIIYEGSKIRVENRLCRERLYINNTLQDECSGLGDRSKRIGRLPDGKLIKVNLGAFWSVHCVIFAEDREILRD